MDFLDPKRKRAHRIKLFIGYALMAVALTLATLILVFEAYGFDLNRKTGNVIQNGLIFVDAHPEAANITLNGESKGQTGSRMVVPSGRYTLELKRDGYRPWSRTFNLDGGSIERMVYPLLFPEKLTTSDVQLYASSPTFSTSSPDHRWVVIQQPGTIGKFDVIDIGSTADTLTPISLPADTLTPATGDQKLTLVEWSTDNRRFLVKHSFDGGVEFIVVDREAPASSVNVNKLFGINPDAVTLRDKRADQFYMYESKGGVLRQADTKTKQLIPLLTNVIAYKSHGSDVVAYITGEKAAVGKVLLRILDKATPYTLKELPAATNYFVDIARYDGHWYVAGGAISEQKVSVYKDPVDTLKAKPAGFPVPISVLKLDTVPESLSFSITTQFIALQGAGQFAVYDAESDRQFRYVPKLTLMPGQQATWMDGNRLAVISANQVIVFDYDGINMQTLSAADPAHALFFDRDYEMLYSLAPSTVVQGRTALTRTSLKAQ